MSSCCSSKHFVVQMFPRYLVCCFQAASQADQTRYNFTSTWFLALFNLYFPSFAPFRQCAEVRSRQHRRLTACVRHVQRYNLVTGFSFRPAPPLFAAKAIHTQTLHSTRTRAPRVGNKCGRQVGDKCKSMQPRAPRVGDKCGRQVGDKCKSMRPRAPRVGDECGHPRWETSVGDPEWETSVGDKCGRQVSKHAAQSTQSGTQARRHRQNHAAQGCNPLKEVRTPYW